MNVTITPSKLIGRVKAPSSKSYSHRMLIAASLADGISEISNINPSEDIEATIDAMTALGAKILRDGNVYTVKGIGSAAGINEAEINCRESGSTMRFVIPVAAALGCKCTYYGGGKLPTRPITPYEREMSLNGAEFDHIDGVMPFTVGGKLRGGCYRLEGDISSQFVSGLLFALPLCVEDSSIILTSPLESKPYADMTVSAAEKFGVKIEENLSENGLPVYNIKGGQKYHSCETNVEGDYSQAAFWFTANALGSEIVIDNLNNNSVQGDKKILEIMDNMGYNSIECGKYKAFTADAADIPDIVPVLAVLGCFAENESRIINAKRLKIKESNRLQAVANALNAIGGRVEAGEDYISVKPVYSFGGGNINGCNDHRIVMASAIASTMANGKVTISDCEAVSKSYPEFWNDFRSLGGIFEFNG